ncbi:MAG: hypothetical protein J5775_05195, partial [Spirochaetales bacterium]|nr:hypothetical protein [Spirochaetales bacterium]
MTFTEEIFRYLDDGSTTLVFPTENASRYHLARYARTRRKSVAASRAIAFDEFARRFAPVHEQKPANKYHRLVFASDFLGSGKTGMSYLFRDEFKAYRQRFVRFIANVLVHLKDEGYSGIEDGRLRRDLDILAENYGKFLSDNGLFEPGWEKHNLDFWPDFNGRYVLVGYDADI